MKNAILWGVTTAMAFRFCIGICTLDSEYIAPSILRMCISGVWLFGFFKANGWFLKVGGKNVRSR